MTRARHVASPSTFGDMRGLPTPTLIVVAESMSHSVVGSQISHDVTYFGVAYISGPEAMQYEKVDCRRKKGKKTYI